MIDDPIVSVVPAESRIDLDRVEYRLKDGPDRLDVYYSMVPVDAVGKPCGEAVRKHRSLKLDANAKTEVLAGIKVGDALAVVRKLAVRTIKDGETTI